ncbi:hypothetical protein [Bacillus ndiopicus]|nr:hypothetical protein [Bacillus ndiopicus]
MPFPTKIEVFKVVADQYEPVELKDDYLTMPTEEGRYIYRHVDYENIGY